MIKDMEFQSVNKRFERSFRENWEREALSDYQGATICYKELARKIELVHICFAQMGIQKGDKVALCARNQYNWAVCFLAALTYGSVPVPLLHEFKPGNIHYLVNHSEAKLLFVDDYIWEGLSENEMPSLSAVIHIGSLKVLSSGNEEFSHVSDSLEKLFAEKYPSGLGPEDLNYYEDSPDELAMINYTSGTSGFSKGVMLPYRSLAANIHFAIYLAEPQMTCDSTVVAMLPSAHMYGLSFDLLFEMSIGSHTHFLTRVPSPKIIMKAFEEVKPEIIIAVPLIIEKVYKSSIKPLVDKNALYLKIPFLGNSIRKKIRDGLIDSFGGSFEEVILGGAAFNPEVESFLRKINFPFTVGYGMTECGPIITYEKWYRTREGSCGKAIPGCCDIRIDSQDPINIPGEVQVKGPNVFLGYYKNEEATANAFTPDGWFRTGDMGVFDEDGYLYLKGRYKCMILGPSGQNIYPEELEAVLNTVNYVVDSLVIDDGGLKALVYPDYRQAEIDGLSKEQLEERLRGQIPEVNRQLPSYAQIKTVEFMPEDFERTPKKNIKRYLYQRS